MDLNDDDVRHVAHLARLGLTEDEVPRFRAELETILAHVSTIGDLDLSGVAPTNHPLGLLDVTGDDVVRPSLPRAEALAPAPDPTDVGFRVPRVAPGEEEA
jgi:aspartyl-tRNA(Asn)/glutamyl-tRNA(Gln) amidotransferase subunit C